MAVHADVCVAELRVAALPGLALFRVFYGGSPEFVNAVNTNDDGLFTPLMSAAAWGLADCVKVLLVRRVNQHAIVRKSADELANGSSSNVLVR